MIGWFWGFFVSVGISSIYVFIFISFCLGNKIFVGILLGCMLKNFGVILWWEIRCGIIVLF